MIGMQYTFRLPDDHDMSSIRARVAERGSLFDKMEGLYEKAFLISEKGVAGALENSYAPFYLWSHPEAMTKFLTGEQFKAVSEAFGRPSVKSWESLYCAAGKAMHAIPRYATREIIAISPDADLEMLRKQEYQLHRTWAEHPDNQAGFIGLDANAWQLVRFALWTRRQENMSDGVETFEVLHLSAPALDPSYFASLC